MNVWIGESKAWYHKGRKKAIFFVWVKEMETYCVYEKDLLYVKREDVDFCLLVGKKERHSVCLG